MSKGKDGIRARKMAKLGIVVRHTSNTTSRMVTEVRCGGAWGT
jgi:hypothetical protein